MVHPCRRAAVVTAISVGLVFSGAGGLDADSKGPSVRPAGFITSWTDFNGDGLDDLAIGAPFDRVGGINAGAVNVIYGSADGLAAADDQLWTEDSLFPSATSHAGDRFGWSLAAGNFNGDSYGDLAIGAPGVDVVDQEGPELESGAVYVLMGSSAGLSTAGLEVLSAYAQFERHIDTTGLEWGTALASLDAYDGSPAGLDGFTDLAIGYPGDIRDGPGGGFVRIFNGSTNAFTGSEGYRGAGQPGARCGQALAAGRFNDSGGWDLAIGCPRFDVGSMPKTDAGEVLVLYDLTTPTQVLRGKLAGQSVESGDRLGGALAAGDLNGDLRDDLAIGAALEDVGSVKDAGAVSIVYAAATGLEPVTARAITADHNGAPGSVKAGDRYGSALTIADLGGLGANPTSISATTPDGAPVRLADLAIGIPRRDVNGVIDAGAVAVLFQGTTGLQTSGNQMWHQDRAGVLDVGERGDRFGSALTAGRYGRKLQSDLVVGIPFEDVGGVSNVGAISVLPGGPDKLSASGNAFVTQDTAGIQGFAGKGDRFGHALDRWIP